MTASILLLPLLIPFFAAVLCIFFWQKTQIHKLLFFLAVSSVLCIAFNLLRTVQTQGILAVQIGNWAAPFGITFVADLLSCIMVLIAAVIALAVFFFSLNTIHPDRVKYGYYPLLLFLLFGLNGAFLTGDVFNLFVWFEILLISCFVLITLGCTKGQLEGAIKYVTLNFLASSFMLAGVGVLYGLTGTLNMAHLAVLIPELDKPALISLAAVFFIISFGIKAAVFPLFFWLPASYHTPPISISAIIAGLLTKAGMYAMIRFFTLIFNHDVAFTHSIILVMSGFTMLIGVLGAAAQNDFRKILSFHIVSQIGYMLMGLAIFTPLALIGTIYFIIHNILVKTNLFLISGVVETVKGTTRLKLLGGLYDKFPLISVMFALAAFSLAGIPPVSGFWGKLMLAKAGLESGYFFIIGLSLVVSLLTLFSMTKIWAAVFWKPQLKQPGVAEIYATEGHYFKDKPFQIGAVILLSVLILFISFNIRPVYNLLSQTADQLLHTESYIQSVLRTNQTGIK